MANPNLRSITTHREFGFGIKMSTATVENVIGNPVGSNALIKVDIEGFSDDGSSDAVFTVQLYNAAGTPICNPTAVGAVAVGTDVVAGTAIGGPVKIVVTAQDGMKLLARFNVIEGQSIGVKTETANTGNILLKYSVATT